MKIGVMSDSHDNLPNIQKALKLFSSEGCKAIVHAGDFVAPFAVKEILKFSGDVYGCFGNNDGEKNGIRKLWEHVYDPPHMVLLGGRNILLMHDLIPLDKIPVDLRSPDVMVHGHTHQASISRKDDNGPLIINPGECGGWLTGKATVAVLDLERLEAKILEIT